MGMSSLSTKIWFESSFVGSHLAGEWADGSFDLSRNQWIVEQFKQLVDVCDPLLVHPQMVARQPSRDAGVNFRQQRIDNVVVDALRIV